MTLELLHSIQIHLFREMTFAEKWAITRGLWKMTWEAIVRAMHLLHPDLTDEEGRQLAAREMARERTII